MPEVIDETTEEEVEEEGIPTSYTAETYDDDTVRQYLNSIANIPLLTPEEEKALTLQIWQAQEKIAELEEQIESTKDPTVLQELAKEKEVAELAYQALRNQMWERNLRLVIKIARGYWSKVAGRMDLSDLIEEGNLGLQEAIKRFNPHKGYKFSTYAFHWIRQAITRAITNKARIIRLPVHVDQETVSIDSARAKLHQQGKKVTISSLAKETGLSPRTVKRAWEAWVFRNLLSLDFPLTDDDDSIKTFGDSIASEEPSPEEKALENGLREGIEEALNVLTQREAEVIRLRFGVCDGVTRTLDQVGKIYGVSRERIRQIEERALAKLRRPWRAKKLREFLEK